MFNHCFALKRSNVMTAYSSSNTTCGVLCVSLPMPTMHFDCIIIYVMSLLLFAWFILSFASLEQSPLAHFLDKLGFSSSALWLTNDFVKSDMVSCREKKEQKLNPGLCRQSHLSSFQYWCPLCLWIIWLSSVLWPSSPCQIGHLGHWPVDNVILTDGFHSLIVSTVFL